MADRRDWVEPRPNQDSSKSLAKNSLLIPLGIPKQESRKEIIVAAMLHLPKCEQIRHSPPRHVNRGSESARVTNTLPFTNFICSSMYFFPMNNKFSSQHSGSLSKNI